MTAATRKLVPINGNNGNGQAHAVHGTEIHWVPAGRTPAEIVAGAPSIHMAWHGRQSLCVDGRNVRLDDEAFLVLNAGHIVSGRGRRDPGACSLSVYFSPELLADAIHEAAVAHADGADSARSNATFTLFEHLRPMDKAVGSVMRYIAHHVSIGIDDPLWYEEQVRFLLRRLLVNELTILRNLDGLTRAKAWKRRENFVRLTRVTDLIHSAYERPLTIVELAEAAHWSPFHMMREFKAFHGISPYEYLQQRRTQAATQLLCSTELSVAEVAEHVGFQERSTLMRRLRRSRGLSARALRLLAHEAAQSPQAAPHRMTTSAASRVDRATSISCVR